MIIARRTSGNPGIISIRKTTDRRKTDFRYRLDFRMYRGLWEVLGSPHYMRYRVEGDRLYIYPASDGYTVVGRAGSYKFEQAANSEDVSRWYGRYPVHHENGTIFVCEDEQEEIYGEA